MAISKIGKNAGKVWETINKHGEISLSQLKKTPTLKDAEANMALGWLAREDKVSFQQKGNSTKITLK